MRNNTDLTRKLLGALVCSLVVSTLFIKVGYSGESSLTDFFKELLGALTSYTTVALLVHYSLDHKERFLWDVFLISVGGSALSFLIQVGIFEGENGLSAYINQARQMGSWKPISDLGIRFLLSTAITSVISLPFV